MKNRTTVSLMSAAIALSGAVANAQSVYYLSGVPAGPPDWKEQISSSSTSPTALSPNPQHLYCMHYGAEAISGYTTNEGIYGGTGLLVYQSYSSGYVAANQSSFIDNYSGMPVVPNLDAWKFSALEYLNTYMPAYSSQVFGSPNALSIDTGVWEIAHEASASQLGDPGGVIGNYDLNPDMEAFFSWMLTGSATVYGTSYTNTNGIWNAGYDNPNLAVNYFNYVSEDPTDTSHMSSPQMQDYVQFQTVPEPTTAIMGLGGALLLFRRRRSASL